MDETIWLSVQEAHDLTGYEKEWLRQLHRLGKVTTKKIGTIILFEKDSLSQYSEERKREVT